MFRGAIDDGLDMLYRRAQANWGECALTVDQLERMALAATRLRLIRDSFGEAESPGAIRFTSRATGLEFWALSSEIKNAQTVRIETQPGLAINMTARGRIEGVDLASGKTLTLNGKIGALVVPTTEPAQALGTLLAGPILNARVWLSADWLASHAEEDPLVERLIEIRADHLKLRQLAVTPRMIAAAYSAATRRSIDSSLSRLHLESCAYEILADAVDALLSSNATSWRRALTAQRVERAEHARHLLSERLSDPPSFEELAQAVGTNVRQLKRDFELRFGRAIPAFVRMQRLEAAAELLSAGHVTISEAAKAAGYADPANFSKAFERHLGILPRAFLKRRR
jgi:AraC-like DNA-binding protein